MSTTWINRGHFYCPHVKPVLVDCNFVVEKAQGNGLGIQNLKGQGVQNVFMNTSATPGLGPNGLLNPNPPAGYIIVQFADNFNRYYGGFSGFVSPLSGSSILVASAGVTAGLTYVITIVGTTTYAGWLSLGMPPGIQPAVGVSFTATASITATGTGAVQVINAAGSGVNHIEVVGDPNTTIGPVPVGGSPNVGGFITLACFGSTGASGINAITAPTNNTVIGLSFYLGQSNVSVAGE